MAVINFRNEVMADGPSGFWRLGEPLGSMKASDETSNHNDGTCSPSGITFGQPGFHGGDTAALFDGLGLDESLFTIVIPSILLSSRWKRRSVGMGRIDLSRPATHPREIELSRSGAI